VFIFFDIALAVQLLQCRRCLLAHIFALLCIIDFLKLETVKSPFEHYSSVHSGSSTVYNANTTGQEKNLNR